MAAFHGNFVFACFQKIYVIIRITMFSFLDFAMNENKKLGGTSLNRGVFVKHVDKSERCYKKVERNEIKLQHHSNKTMFGCIVQN
jgi:hypothetical protein